MKIKVFLFFCILFFFIQPLRGLLNAEYRTVETPLGKAVTGISREEALEKFGAPEQADEDIWYYSSPDKLFVLFSGNTLLNLYLYPRSYTTDELTPLEFKVFGYSSDLKVKEITQEAELLISNPGSFIFEKPGVIIPKRAGKYQILAKYRGMLSNPAQVVVKEQQKKDDKESEKLLSIHVLPYKPVTPAKSQLSFIALGTFLEPPDKYSVRDVGNQASWYVKQDKQAVPQKNRRIFFMDLGNLDVFCKFGGLDSYPQEVTVEEKPSVTRGAVKHIMLLPEFITVSSGKNIKLLAFATYDDNGVEEVTRKVQWQVKDRDIVENGGEGEFLAKSAGVSEVTGVLGALKSLAVKIIVTDKPEAKFPSPAEERKIDTDNLARDIKNEVERIKDDLVKEEKRLILIKIIPDILVIPVGEERHLSAEATYSDNSKEDLTRLGDWIGSDDKIVKVSQGKAEASATGEAKIYVKFKGVKSLPALVRVEGPKLVSIVVSPQNLQIAMRDKFALKAEGYFSDSSRKDITSLVSWKITNPRIVRIETGKIIPLRFGQTQASAEYLGVKSLPANIGIIFTMDWLLYIIAKIALFLFLGIVAAFIILYVLTEKKKDDLKSAFQNNPREFIVGLYGNARRILSVFDFCYRDNLTWLSYAELAEKKYAVENSAFLKFTSKFEEARYSHHELSAQDASIALTDYNDFLKIMVSRYDRLPLFLKYCQTLLCRSPLFIPYP